MDRVAAGVIETAKRTFFGSFFRLLLGFIALAEWACIAWVLFAVGLRPPGFGAQWRMPTFPANFNSTFSGTPGPRGVKLQVLLQEPQTP